MKFLNLKYFAHGEVRKRLGFLLSLALIFTMVPISAAAEEDAGIVSVYAINDIGDTVEITVTDESSTTSGSALITVTPVDGYEYTSADGVTITCYGKSEAAVFTTVPCASADVTASGSSVSTVQNGTTAAASGFTLTDDGLLQATVSEITDEVYVVVSGTAPTEKEAEVYTISLEGSVTNATATLSADTWTEYTTDSITLTVTADDGYCFKSPPSIKVSQGDASVLGYAMPSSPNSLEAELTLRNSQTVIEYTIDSVTADTILTISGNAVEVCYAATDGGGNLSNATVSFVESDGVTVYTYKTATKTSTTSTKSVSRVKTASAGDSDSDDETTGSDTTTDSTNAASSSPSSGGSDSVFVPTPVPSSDETVVYTYTYAAAVAKSVGKVTVEVLGDPGYGFTGEDDAPTVSTEPEMAYTVSDYDAQTQGYTVTFTVTDHFTFDITAAASKIAADNATDTSENALAADVDTTTLENAVTSTLTEEEQDAISNGEAYVSVALSSSAISYSDLDSDEKSELSGDGTTLPSDAMADVREALADVLDKKTANGLIASDVSIASYLELSLYAAVNYYSGTSGSASAVSNLGTAISINLDLSDLSLNAVSSGKVRTYFMIRLHKNNDGSYTRAVLPCTTNDDGTISFETDRFSTYVLGYADTDKTTDSGSTDGNSGGSTDDAGADSENDTDSDSSDTGSDSDTGSENTDNSDSGSGSDAGSDTGSDTNGSDSSSSVAVGEKYSDSATGYVYKVTSKNAVTFTDAKTNKKSVTVPSKVKIDGNTYKVTAIANNAFKGNKKLTIVKIGSYVKKIGKNAFKNCAKLKKITISTTKLTNKTVGKNAFQGIAKKAVVKVPASKVKAYKKILRNKGAGKKVTVKKK